MRPLATVNDNTTLLLCLKGSYYLATLQPGHLLHKKLTSMCVD